MNADFATIARQLAPVAAQMLGWRPHEFWRSTPEELSLSLSPLDTAGGHGLLSRADLHRMLEHEDNG